MAPIIIWERGVSFIFYDMVVPFIVMSVPFVTLCVWINFNFFHISSSARTNIYARSQSHPFKSELTKN
jgi:hypothetical protein